MRLIALKAHTTLERISFFEEQELVDKITAKITDKIL